MTFNVRGGTDPKLILNRMITESTQFRHIYDNWPLILSDIIITEDLDKVVEFRKYMRIFKEFPKAHLHEYGNLTTLCLVFQFPDTERLQVSTLEISNEDLYIGCGVGSMPKKCWWRPRKQGRDRDFFEADTDSDSDGQDHEHSGRSNKESVSHRIVPPTCSRLYGYDESIN
jgi:hypothetical protein